MATTLTYCHCGAALSYVNARDASEGLECQALMRFGKHNEATAPSRSASSAPTPAAAPVESVPCWKCKTPAALMEPLPESRGRYSCAKCGPFVSFNAELLDFAKKHGLTVAEARALKKQAQRDVSREERTAAARKGAGRG